MKGELWANFSDGAAIRRTEILWGGRNRRNLGWGIGGPIELTLGGRAPCHGGHV